jgi:hypothetical protein
LQLKLPVNLPAIDWQSIKSVTVEKANLCYFAGDHFGSSQWLVPIVSLWTTVDTGQGNVEVEMFCQAIVDAKP